MIPVFGHIFGEPIPAYFTLLMVGFGVATFLAAYWSKRAGYDHDVIIDLGLLSVIAGVVGGRLLHVIADGYFWDYVHLCTDPSQVVWKVVESAAECAELEGAWHADTSTCHARTQDCFAWAKFWNGGLAYYGGLFVASASGLWFLRRERFPLGHGIDAVGAALPIGIFFGRLGCFFGGCCFGVVTHGPLGLTFPRFSAASEKQYREGLLASKSLESLPVHPAQLYEAAGCLLLGLSLTLWLQPRKRFHGQVMLAFLGGYAVLRFLIEFVRADDRGGLLGLSTSQLLGVLMIGLVAALWARLGRSPHMS
ncbi:MAG: prolipoprotein diacylglyceryl transferase [Myxococcales bacterium]|nr:prolipoprotein diacylglyceryl transferase [Myxococcales bacterium]MDD9970636.1 prolipoprotein diacylglyceryl transferase [Myxococcales bacterium]